MNSNHNFEQEENSNDHNHGQSRDQDRGRGRGRHRGGPRGGHRQRGGGRRGRGDVRLALLALIDEEPRHGYELMPAIAERTDGSIEGVALALKQVIHVGSPEQVNAAAKVLADAQRSLYLILAQDPTQREADNK